MFVHDSQLRKFLICLSLALHATLSSPSVWNKLVQLLSTTPLFFITQFFMIGKHWKPIEGQQCLFEPLHLTASRVVPIEFLYTMRHLHQPTTGCVTSPLFGANQVNSVYVVYSGSWSGDWSQNLVFSFACLLYCCGGLPLQNIVSINTSPGVPHDIWWCFLLWLNLAIYASLTGGSGSKFRWTISKNGCN